MNRKIFLLTLISLLLTACGSGSSHSNETATSTDIDFRLLPADYFDEGYQQAYSFTGISNLGDRYTATKTVTTQAESIYDGLPAVPLQASFSITNTINYASSSSNSIEYYSTDANARMRLAMDLLNGNAYTANSLDILPETARIGDSGNFGTYLGSGTENGKTLSASWALTNANSGFANLVITTDTRQSGTLITSQQTITKIDTAGKPQTQKIILKYPQQGVTITLNGSPTY